MRVALWCPAIADLNRRQMAIGAHSLVHTELADMAARVREAGEAGAGVFLAPEFYYTRLLRLRHLCVGVDWANADNADDLRFAMSLADFGILTREVEGWSRTYPGMLIVAGTMLWFDGAGQCSNTCVYAIGGQVAVQSKNAIDAIETKMMRAPRNENHQVNPGAAAFARTPGPTLGTGRQIECSIEICRDLGGGPRDLDLILVPAYMLGVAAPVRIGLIVCDASGTGYVIMPAAGGHGQLYRPFRAGFHLFDIPDGHIEAVRTGRLAPPAAAASGKWVPRHLRGGGDGKL